MPTRSLTVAGVARIKPPKAGQVDYFDAGYPGLALRVSYGGAKSFVYFYRLHGKLRRLSLGRFPGMSLDEAREAWRSARLAVSKGENPAHIRPTTADSFRAVADEWLKRDQAENRSAAEVRRTIERDVLPVWGDRLVAAITRRDVTELLDGVVDRGAVIMARRLHSHLHRLFRWAVGRGIIETNPMADLPKPGAAVKRDRVLADTELRAVWMAAGGLAWPFGPAIKLLILTAARREEIGSLSWSEVHGNEIRLPAARSKSGEARTIPLSPAAIKLIDGLPRAGNLVFSTNGATSISGWGKAKRTLDAATAEIAGAPLAPWRLHDLRRTAATGLQRLGVGLQTIESVLGHVSGSRAGIVGVYQRHRFEVEKRAALDAWAREIERIAGVKEAPPAPESAVQGAIVYAGAALKWTGSLAVDAEVRPVDKHWVEAIGRADKEISPKPLIDYLRQPRAQLGPGEAWWLLQLLERMQFKRRTVGNFVPLGQRSRKEIYQIGAALVRDLQQREGLSQPAAIDRAAKMHPGWFGPAGRLLANFIKRGA